MTATHSYTEQDRVARAAMDRAVAVKKALRAADRAFVEVVREELRSSSVAEVAERASMSRGNVYRMLRAYPEIEREETQ